MVGEESFGASIRACAIGGGAGVEGRGLQAVGKSKGEKRVASGERPDTSGVVGENKLRKMSEPVEWIVMFKVRGQKPVEGGFRVLNPLRVTAALVGMGFQARTLSNGLLSKDKKLFEEAKEVGKLVVKGESFLPKGGPGTKRSDLWSVRLSIWEGNHVFRFNPEEGGDKDSPVLLTFADGVMPKRAYVGTMAYRVREYVKAPLQCYNCPRFEHVAGSCRAEEIKECKAASPACCNCGGDHMVGYQGCEHFIQARGVQSVRDQHKVTHAVAVKRVEREPGGGSITSNSRSGNRQLSFLQ